MSFNLLIDSWIPVLYQNGTWARIGIQKAFEDSSTIRQIAASNPMDRAAILRLLIAILYWCKGNPDEATNNVPNAPLPMEWFGKLEDNKESFNLLGDGKRFYQSENYRTVKPGHTINYLIQEVPTGNNWWHFRHSTDLADGLCQACCALGLIRLPAFATSGGKGMTSNSGKSPGINGKPPLYAFSFGDNLAMTLRLSWRKVDVEVGTPEWETPNQALPANGNVPLLVGITWMPRHIWLEEPGDPAAACILCSQKTRLIRRCALDGKGSSKGTERYWTDPNALQRPLKRGEVNTLHAADALGSSNAAAGQWSTIVSALDQSALSERVWVAGLSSVQNDKYLEAIEMALSLSGEANLTEKFRASFKRWNEEGAKLSRKMRPRGEKSNSRKHVEIQSILDAIRPDVEQRVYEMVGELASASEQGWNKAAQEYSSLMSAIAKSLSPGFTSASLQRRREITHAKPAVSAPTSKPLRKTKGDNK